MRIFLIFFFCILSITACNTNEKNKRIYLEKIEGTLPGKLSFKYPRNGTVFPPEFPPPSFIWSDNNHGSKKWLLNIKADGEENIHTEIIDIERWQPDSVLWEEIKKKSVNNPATFTVLGINPEQNKEILSGTRIEIFTSTDSVGAPIFYRAVPLPFRYATTHLDSIKYMLADISSRKSPRILIEKLPVCGNCHSFSLNGEKFAMDVDAFGDKGSYLIADLKEDVEMVFEKFITWSDFHEKTTMALLSQISPDGKYVISTLDDNEIFEARDDQLEYSQLFFPIKGILVTYDIENKRYFALPGADDTTYVQSNSSWTPDSKFIYFTRSRAVQRKQSGMTYGTGVYDLNRFQVLRDSFLLGIKPFKFDIMKIPFNNGKGGKAIPVDGASKNKISNYFPKISPDGKWIVFCRANNYMLLQPDSKLYIMPTKGGEPRLMNCNTSEMNSWHSWSPNGKWIVFSTKLMGPYTQLFLTHIDENGNDTPPVWLEYLTVKDRAANIPEFINTQFAQFGKISDKFSHIADYNVRGTSKAQFGDFKEAINDFNKALQINPEDHYAYANRGKAKDELGDMKGAIEDLTTAIKLLPEEYDYYVHRSNVKVKLKDIKGAISDCDKAIKIKSSDATLYAHRAGIYQLTNNFDKAMEDFNKAILLDPSYSIYYVHRANLYKLLNNRKKAIADLNKAIENEPGNVRYITMRGAIKSEFNDILGAVEDFEKAIKINPQYYEPYMRLAIINEANDKLQAAVENYTKAIDACDKNLKRDLAIMYNNRGTIYGKMSDYTKAIYDFDNAINLWNNFVDAYSNRAFAKLNMKLYSEAIEDCNLALQIDPNFKKAQYIKQLALRK